jgi:hypothetical protein
MINRGHAVPLTRQCQMLNLSRSGIYYAPWGPVSFPIPTDKSLSYVFKVKIVMDKAVNRAEEERTIVRPSSRWLMMCTITTHIDNRVSLSLLTARELDGYSEGIAYDGAPQASQRSFFE